LISIYILQLLTAHIITMIYSASAVTTCHSGRLGQAAMAKAVSKPINNQEYISTQQTKSRGR